MEIDSWELTYCSNANLLALVISGVKIQGDIEWMNRERHATELEGDVDLVVAGK